MPTITKFEKITSVGKFYDFSAKGDIAFKDLTLIYADNGSGKTTLTSIFRSLLQNNNTLLRNRISDQSTLDQAVILKYKDTAGLPQTVSFGKNGWKKHIANFEIFDSHFVDENIFSGFSISDEHKKGLHQFVVGAQGVAIKNKIARNKIKKAEVKERLETLSKLLFTKVGNGLSEALLKDFIKLKVSDEKGINEKILVAEKNKANAVAQKAIIKYPEVSLIANWKANINFTQLQKDIAASSKTIKDAAIEKKFTQHSKELENNKVDNAEDWLRTGFSYVIHKMEDTITEMHEIDCPFCQQNLEPSLELLKSFELIFDDEFNAYVERLTNFATAVTRLDIENLKENRKQSKALFNQSMSLWNIHVAEEIPRFVVLTDTKKLDKNYDNLKTALNAKLKNPTKPLAAKIAMDLKDCFNEVNSNIDKTNRAISSYNSRIRKFKTQLKNPDDAERELQALNRIKKRFSPDIDKLCQEYQEANKNNRILEEEYTKLAEDEEKDANHFISKYAAKINHYLKNVFNTPFQIGDMQHGARKGRSRDAKVEYNLLLNRTPISFDCDDPFSTKDCLSEGDKSTIAFSFFLAKMELDPNYRDKILVFDDPLSSFDSNRRHTTVKIIREISEDIQQTIVLSHNESFLWDLYRTTDASKRKALRINQDYNNSHSFIEPLDIEFLVQHEYFSHVEELEGWLTSPDIRKKERVISLLRNVLESHIKFKFYRQLIDIDPTKQTFGSCIDELESAGIKFRDETNRKDVIYELRQLNAISCEKHHGGTLPDPKTFGIDPNKITDTELAGFIRKTFLLIDERL